MGAGRPGPHVGGRKPCIEMMVDTRRRMRWGAHAFMVVALLVSVLAWSGGVAVAQENSTTGDTGAVYVLTNGPMKNEVVAYHRAADGALTMMERYDTGGLGSGAYENSDTALVLGSSEAQSSPVDLGGGSDLLFAVNPGSDEISVFQVGSDGSLELVETEPSGGERPISLSVNKGVLYVLNSAGDGLPGAGFCHGGMPEITGFRVDESGELTPIPDSTRKLSGGGGSGCAQVQFNPDGTVLIVTQITADKIDTFTVDESGVAHGPIVNETAGMGPFGVAFDSEGRVLMTENFGAAEERGAVVSYNITGDGALEPIGDSMPIGETDPCWFVLTPDGEYAFTSSFGPNPILAVEDEGSRRGTLSSYRVGDDGSLELLDAQAAQIGVGAADIALGGNGRYIYTLNTIEGKVYGHRVEPDGSLTEVTVVGGIPTNMPGPLSGGIAAWDSGADDMPGSMPDTGGGGATTLAGPSGVLSLGNVAALLSMLAGGGYIGRRRR